jgi:hypothetical protein
MVATVITHGVCNAGMYVVCVCVLCYAAARVASAPAPAPARVCILPVLPRIVSTYLPGF